jgi:predicted nuclease of predicted toxin-antitoxin system
MKFLLDVCASSRSLRALLVNLGHDVRLVGEDDPSFSDEKVLSLAHQEGRLVITQDKDFGELVFVQHRPHAGIIRFLDMPVAEQVVAMQEVLSGYRPDLESGAMIVVTRGRIRVRP